MRRGDPSVTFLIFTLAAMLIAFVYYKGLTADVVAVGNASSQLLNTVTGRNASGGPFQTVAGY